MPRVHATCIAIAETGILIRGPSGSGKSDLALRLIDGGAVLVADDYVDIAPAGGRLEAATPGAIAGLIEVRGFGVVRIPYRAKVMIGLAVDLRPVEDIERLPDRTTTSIEGVSVPWIELDAQQPSAAARIRFVVNALTAGTRVTTDATGS
ncbi:MAG: HPr kinase/phosphatase C-terminal domain-containing protein [Rhodobacteraceae bacterium]|nr:HPr kinase/phosphatase C-terminal domain-containing protein [Paracoccaceae bacterium]